LNAISREDGTSKLPVQHQCGATLSEGKIKSCNQDAKKKQGAPRMSKSIYEVQPVTMGSKDSASKRERRKTDSSRKGNAKSKGTGKKWNAKNLKKPV